MLSSSFLSITVCIPLKIKMSSLQTLLPWPIWSFTLPIWTTPTLTATLSPPGPLEIGPELLLITLWKKTFDSSQRSWIGWCPGAPGFEVALMCFLCVYLRFSNLEITITIIYNCEWRTFSRSRLTYVQVQNPLRNAIKRGYVTLGNNNCSIVTTMNNIVDILSI